MENFQFLAKKSWFKKWWGVTIIVVICLFLSFSLAIGLLTWRYKQLIKQGYDSAKTEHQIMEERGYLRIYDCGSAKFELKLR